MRSTLLLPAAGSGSRFGGLKQLHPLLGEAVLVWSLRPFLALVDEIVIACPPAHRDALAAVVAPLCEPPGAPACRFVAGGAQRQDSVHAALQAASPEHEAILVHDAARPLVTPELVTAVRAALDDHPAALAALPCHDTVKRDDGKGLVAETVPREDLWLAQTPQGFRRSAGLAAYAAAAAAGWYGTDDAAVLARAGHPVALVPGSPENIKVTTPADLVIAEAILHRRGAG